MNTFLRSLNSVLLAAILAVLSLVFHRMPITLADFKDAKPSEREAMLLRRALVQLTDRVSVTVDNTPLPVEIEGTPTVEIDGTPTVEIDNTPLPVQIQR